MTKRAEGRDTSEDIRHPEDLRFALQASVHAPCEAACPLDLQCAGYISLIAEGKFEDAYKLIRQRLAFPMTLGRICNAPCELRCRRELMDEAVAIRDLKRFVADYACESGMEYMPKSKAKRQEKVAIVGAGPAGLSAAYDLARYGFQVTVFEALPVAGGLLVVGCPEFRLPRKIVEMEIENVTKLGVEIQLNHRVTNIVSLFDQDYKAVFIAVGAERGSKLSIPGADLCNVFTGRSFLSDVSLGKDVKLAKSVVVLGGGGVAIDCARVALRLGAKVNVVCLEPRGKIPADPAEVLAAEEEGVVICSLRTCTRVLGRGGCVTGVECLRLRAMKFESGGRLHIDAIQDSEHVLAAGTVIFAVGQVPELKFDPPSLRVTEQGLIAVDSSTMATNMLGVFAGGDVATNAGSVAQAMADGQKAALSITTYLNGEEPPAVAKRIDDEVIAFSTVRPDDNKFRQGDRRIWALSLSAESRRRSFNEVRLTYASDVARAEAARCLRCDLVQPAQAQELELVSRRPLDLQIDEIRKLYQPAPATFYRRAILHDLGVHYKRKDIADNVIFLTCGIFGMLLENVAALMLLDRLGVDYTYLKREKCCGFVQLEDGIGSSKDMEMVEKALSEINNWNLDQARERGASRAVHLCQWCTYVCKKYQTSKDIDVVYFPDLFVENLDKFVELNPALPPTKVGYYEGCHLRRVAIAPKVEWDWKPYRKLLEVIKGVEIADLSHWKCCLEYSKDIVDEAKGKNLDCVVTPCASCFGHIERYGARMNFRVKMIQQIMLEAIGEKTFEGFFLPS